MLTIAVGLPGSGKTMLATIEALRDLRVVLIDDALGEHSPGQATVVRRLVSAARLGRPAFVADALLCIDARRADFARAVASSLPPDCPARWLYFANSPEACRRNVELRHRAELARSVNGSAKRRCRALALIDELAPAYRIPDGAEAVEVTDYSGWPGWQRPD